MGISRRRKKKKGLVIDIPSFFRDSFTDFSAYASYRAIGSSIDGLKNSQRKLFYTLLHTSSNNKEKVSRLASITGLKTEYLHGEASLESTIVNAVRHFDKPLPLLAEEGSFGFRTITKAAASRYIYTKKLDLFSVVFNKKFARIDGNQNFEGTKIEPKVMTPLLPMLLINGNSGIGSGFSQNILPRNPKQIKEVLEKYLKSKAKNRDKILKDVVLDVSYPDYSGTSEDIEGKTYFTGVIKKANTSTLKITELPIGYTLDAYIKVLEGLIDNNTITSYNDSSNKNLFGFEIKIKRNVLSAIGDDKLIEKFKLKKSVTENFVCVSADNSFLELESYNDVLVIYMEFMLKRYAQLKALQIADLKQEIFDLSEKARFIKLVIEGEIVVSNRARTDISKQLRNHNFREVDVYLNMRIYSLTKERFDQLLKDVEIKKKELAKLEEMTIEKLYLVDLSKLNSFSVFK